jgi:hypothetical protein
VIGVERLPCYLRFRCKCPCKYVHIVSEAKTGGCVTQALARVIVLCYLVVVCYFPFDNDRAQGVKVLNVRSDFALLLHILTLRLLTVSQKLPNTWFA